MGFSELTELKLWFTILRVLFYLFSCYFVLWFPGLTQGSMPRNHFWQIPGDHLGC